MTSGIGYRKKKPKVTNPAKMSHLKLSPLAISDMVLPMLSSSPKDRKRMTTTAVKSAKRMTLEISLLRLVTPLGLAISSGSWIFGSSSMAGQ